jgi:hypothetical protein
MGIVLSDGDVRDSQRSIRVASDRQSFYPLPCSRGVGGLPGRVDRVDHTGQRVCERAVGWRIVETPPARPYHPRLRRPPQLLSDPAVPSAPFDSPINWR